MDYADRLHYNWVIAPRLEKERKQKLLKELISLMRPKIKPILTMHDNGLSLTEMSDALEIPEEAIKIVVDQYEERKASHHTQV